jgi:hypothetical protein
MKEQATTKHGGTRNGAGRPKSEPTTIINFRIPAKVKTDIKKRYGKKLNKLFNDWLKSI